jgi:glycosyltransferase involved in cell wall biosynthesis
VTRWHADRGAALDELSRHNLYFAPRLREGIGLAFLEAMAMGLLVVAPARPTMTEYLTPGVNGLLYEPAALQPLDLTHHAAMGARARADAAEGFAAFSRDWPTILEFIAAPPRRRASAGRRTLEAARNFARRFLGAGRERPPRADLGR